MQNRFLVVGVLHTLCFYFHVNRALAFMCPQSLSFHRKNNRKQNRSAENTLQALPELIVFDLDNTLWSPELYQLRKLQKNNVYPIAHEDVKLFPAAWDVINHIRKDPLGIFVNTKFAVASRTKSVDWAQDLLKQFELEDFFHYVEIFPGDKKRHFNNLKRRSGIDFDRMLFFDDSRDGKFGNCEPVSQLGVLSVHCPDGIHKESIFHDALNHYKNWYTGHRSPNTIVEEDGKLTTNRQIIQNRYDGIVKMINKEKKYGFIGGYSCDSGRKSDIFFHFSAINSSNKATTGSVQVGDALSFTISTDSRTGKLAATDIDVMDESSGGNTNVIKYPAFSMNMPFAALLANGYKTIETRNGTMFTRYPEGTKMLLHVGRRNYPDGNRHVDVMKSGGLDDQEILKMKSLPDGYAKGMLVAILEIGKTYETTLEQRCDPTFQRSVVALGEDSGVRATEIRRVQYLKHGVKIPGQSGVFNVELDKNAIPEEWL
jgi:HAD-superfamily phosphatase, subfamily IIIC